MAYSWQRITSPDSINNKSQYSWKKLTSNEQPFNIQTPETSSQNKVVLGPPSKADAAKEADDKLYYRQGLLPEEPGSINTENEAMKIRLTPRWKEVADKYGDLVDREEQAKKNPVAKWIEGAQRGLRENTFGDTREARVAQSKGVNLSTGSQIGDITSNLFGTAIGFAANPGGGSLGHGLEYLGEKAAGKIPAGYVRQLIKGAAMGAPAGAYTSIVQGKNPQEVAKDTIMTGLLGGVLVVGTKGAADVFSVITSKLKNSTPLTTAENNIVKANPELFETELPKPQSNIVFDKKPDKLSFKQALSNFYTRVVDVNNPIKKTGEQPYILASNSKNVGGIVDYNMQGALVDKAGNKVGKSLKDVVNEVPKGQENDFWQYMSQRHNIDRAREGKPVQANYTPEMSMEAVSRAEQTHPEYKKIGDDITNWIDKFMQTWGVDTGIVDKDIYAELRTKYKSYFPTQRDFSTLEDAIPGGVSRKFVDQTSPIKKATGSDRDIINPVENIMNLVNRTIRTAKYNEVGQELLNSVRKDPEKLQAFAEIIPTNEGMFSNKDNVVTVMENGKPTYLQINNKELLDSLNGLPKVINNLPTLRKITNVYKSLITQKNPVFAIRNIMRDIPTAYVYGSTKNPIKFAADIGKAGQDILSNSERFQRYKAVGGGGANFFNGKNVAESAAELTGRENPIKKIAKAPLDAIETFNNLIETAPRLAEFNRTLEKTGDVNKALYAANDVTVNFSRGGDIAKKVDAAVPYFNAGVQGIDKFFRGFNSPKTALATLTKAGVSVTVPTIGLYLLNRTNPYYKALDNRTKDAYYVIPNILDKDKNGIPKSFIKIPKSRELSVLFSSLFERALRAAEEQKNAFKGFANTVATNFAPTNPVENNVFSPFTYNLPTNKDFAGRAIVPQGMVSDKRSPYLQYDEKTSEIAKKIGELTKDINGGLSPKQIDYVIRSYTGVVGQMGLPLATKGNDPTKSITSQFKADPLYSNQTVTDFYDNIDMLKRTATDKNLNEKIPSKVVTKEERLSNRFADASKKISNLSKQIMNLDQVKDKAKIEALRQQILDIANNTNSLLH